MHKRLKGIAAILTAAILLTSCSTGGNDSSSVAFDIPPGSEEPGSSVIQSCVSTAVSDLLSSAIHPQSSGESSSGGNGGGNTAGGDKETDDNGNGGGGGNTADGGAAGGDRETDNGGNGGGETADPYAPPPAGHYSEAISILLPSAPGSEAYSDGETTIDVSNKARGYFMFRTSHNTGARMKIQVITDSGTYNYDIGAGYWETFPLQMGSGVYTVRLMENTQGTKYRKIYSMDFDVSLNSSLGPYCYPNQYVDYGSGSSAVRKSFDLCVNASGDIQKVMAIYSYIVNHISYDYGKANSVSSGYLPNVDSILSSGYGICFDYAALAACMLRAQGIPTQLAIGTVNGLSHAWNYIYVDGAGWITADLYFNGYTWNFADMTFAAAGVGGGSYSVLRRY